MSANTITVAQLMQEPIFGNICIIGQPATGKTLISKMLATKLPDHAVFHADDYIVYGWEESMYRLLDDILPCPQPTIVEGIAGYRLLRKGAQLKCYYPEAVIEMSAPYEQITRVYATERDPEKIKNLKAFMGRNDTVLNAYLEIEVPEDLQPRWLKVENIF